jgi:hypothetical protein
VAVRDAPALGDNPGRVGSQAMEIHEELGFAAYEITALDEAEAIRLPHDLPQVERWT